MTPTSMSMTKVKDRLYLIIRKTSSDYLINAVLPKIWIIPNIVLCLPMYLLPLSLGQCRWKLSLDEEVNNVGEPWLKVLKSEDEL